VALKALVFMFIIKVGIVLGSHSCTRSVVDPELIASEFSPRLPFIVVGVEQLAKARPRNQCSGEPMASKKATSAREGR